MKRVGQPLILAALERRANHSNQLRIRVARPTTKQTVKTAGTSKRAIFAIGATIPVIAKTQKEAVIAAKRTTMVTLYIGPSPGSQIPQLGGP